MRYFKLSIFLILILTTVCVFMACGSSNKPQGTTAAATSGTTPDTSTDTATNTTANTTAAATSGTTPDTSTDTAANTTANTTAKATDAVTTPTTVAESSSAMTTKTEETTTPTVFDENVYQYKNTTASLIIPQPKEATLLQKDEGYALYRVNPTIATKDEDFAIYLDAFIGYTKKIINVTITKDEGGITLYRDTTLSAGEYRIVCASDGVTLSAADNDGITYALATLHQLLALEGDVLTIPAYHITDKPDASYRTLMVDLARKYHTLDQVLDYIDLCYLYKIKFLHLHFTDREAYRLPSEAFPKLTASQGYSKEDIATLNQYALERNIEIIPEIDLPGHAVSLTSAYPELFGHDHTYGSVTNDVVCIGKPDFYKNLQTLLNEIAEMFPNSRYLHIGGDEADFSTITNCADCGQYIFDNDITSLEMFYTYFIKNATEMVLAMGKTPIVWEGFPKEGSEMLSRDIIVTGWESYYHLPNELIEEGFTVTNSSWVPLYITRDTLVPDGRWYPEDILEWDPYTWRNWWSASPASQNPIVVEPTDQVIGGALCAWEITYAQNITPIKENLAAMSERLWNVNATLNLPEYIKALNEFYKIADKVLAD